MEDVIEKSHQTGKQRRGRFSLVVDLQVKAVATQRVVHRNSDPAVVSCQRNHESQHRIQAQVH
jgi:hypothetical protein